MAQWVEVRTGDEDCGMQFTEKIVPSLTNKKIKVAAKQDITVTAENGTKTTDTLTGEKEFWIAGRAFTIDQADVYSVSPAENASGNFANQLPHITLKKKTFPWEYEMPDGGPWLSLLTLAEGECTEKDIPISALKTEEEGVYFPCDAQPQVYLEADSDNCHVIDIEIGKFLNISPQKGERQLLAHGKFLNMLDKSDASLEMDGYFSTVIGGRFLTSVESSSVKSTMHLVSMLGYDDPDKIRDLQGYEKVRLVSLYHWSAYSDYDGQQGFTSIIEGLDSGTLRIDSDNEILSHGYVPKRHLFRTGESTVSLYRGPLVPFQPSDTGLDWKDHIPKTADGALIFNKDTDLFDASYSAAWQLGRLLTVQNKAIAGLVVKWRRDVETRLRKIVAGNFLKGKLGQTVSAAGIAEQGLRGLLSAMEKGGAEDEKMG